MLLQVAKFNFFNDSSISYHIVFIHLSVVRHLVCFHILATVNNAAVKAEVHLSFLLKYS